jgi:hypothetical protein
MPTASFAAMYSLTDTDRATKYPTKTEAELFALFEGFADNLLTARGWTRDNAWGEATKRIWSMPSGVEITVEGGDTTNTSRYRIWCVATHA